MGGSSGALRVSSATHGAGLVALIMQVLVAVRAVKRAPQTLPTCEVDPPSRGRLKLAQGRAGVPFSGTFGLFRCDRCMQGRLGTTCYVSRPHCNVCGRFRRAARCVSTRAKPRSSGRDFGQARVAWRHLSVVAAAQGCMTMMKVSTVLPCAQLRLAASEHGMVSRHRQRVDVVA